MKHIAYLISSLFLVGCGAYSEKYSTPKNIDNMIPIKLTMIGSEITPQAAFFENGESCSGLRDLQMSKEVREKNIYTRQNAVASFHILGLVSVKFTRPSTATLEMHETTCGNQIISFPTELATNYALQYKQSGESCSLRLIKNIDGKLTDVSSTMKRRDMSFDTSKTASSSFCNDRFSGQPGG